MGELSKADVLERLADLFGTNVTGGTPCPVCGSPDFDGPGLISHLFRRCDGDAPSYFSDSEIVAVLRKAAAKARGEGAL